MAALETSGGRWIIHHCRVLPQSASFRYVDAALSTSVR
jgi:hypothetical protein